MKPYPVKQERTFCQQLQTCKGLGSRDIWGTAPFEILLEYDVIKVNSFGDVAKDSLYQIHIN